MISKNQVKKLLTEIGRNKTSNGKPVNSRQNIEMVYNTTKNCINCDSASRYIALWTPDKSSVPSAVFDGQANSQQGRTIFYGMCDSCYGYPNQNELIEDKIITSMLAKRN